MFIWDVSHTGASKSCYSLPVACTTFNNMCARVADHSLELDGELCAGDNVKAGGGVRLVRRGQCRSTRKVVNKFVFIYFLKQTQW